MIYKKSKDESYDELGKKLVESMNKKRYRGALAVLKKFIFIHHGIALLDHSYGIQGRKRIRNFKAETIYSIIKRIEYQLPIYEVTDTERTIIRGLITECNPIPKTVKEFTIETHDRNIYIFFERVSSNESLYKIKEGGF